MNGRAPQPAPDDRQIIDACLAGDETAWDTLYEWHHRRLLSFVRTCLASRAADDDLVDEIAARVWYALVRDNARLLRQFDAGRGCRLATFLAILAKTETAQHFRGEQRRKNREFVAASNRAERVTASMEDLRATMEEFLATLSPRERQYSEAVLLSQRGLESISQANAWKLNSRVRKKLEAFLQQG